MECNVVKDLIPLYIDSCCSQESAAIVKEHIDSCPDCKAIYESMNTASETGISAASAPEKLSRINNWKASILQSVLLFAAFALITIGVALEAATPSGFSNGYWAFTLVIPATGFMLSLANWYFVRLYKSRKSFSNASLLATIIITLGAYIWAGFHYGANFFILNIGKLLFLADAGDWVGIILLSVHFFGIGILLTAVFCILSKVLSSQYAKMLGKE